MHQGTRVASVSPSPRFHKDPSSPGLCPNSKAEKTGMLEALLLLNQMVPEGSTRGAWTSGQKPCSWCCAGLSWHTPLWAGSDHCNSPQKSSSLGRLSLFRETVAPQVPTGVVKSCCTGAEERPCWSPHGTASPQHEGKQTGHHCSPAGSSCPFRHKNKQFTPLLWASTLNKYFSTGYKEIYLLRTILYV